MKLHAALPSRGTVRVLAALAVASSAALVAGVPLRDVAAAAGVALSMGLAWVAGDALRAWQRWRDAPLEAKRRAPTALALGSPTRIQLQLTNAGTDAWQVEVFDEADARLAIEGLPQRIVVPAGSRADIAYTVTALRRGPARFGAVQVRSRSPLGTFELVHRLGQPFDTRVYPDFSAVAGYAWLAGDKRLAQIGIKQYAQRGLGTDFRQLSEYRAGDSLRHIDWKATLRQGKPIVREFQDERDQCVFFLLDCGRRMRADDGRLATGGSHFDQALNALMLLGYVALKEGDEVGAMTFGTLPGQQRLFAPRKGVATLNALMNTLYDLEPEAVHSDYLQAARELMLRHPRRAFVILLTNFRGDDVSELRPALDLLRQRHLVMVASLRETVLADVASQSVASATQAAEVATAHLFAQARHDAFRRITAGDALSVDVEPRQLPVALVNRYHAVKRAGLL